MLIKCDRLSTTPTPRESQPFENHRSSTEANAIFDLYGRDDELEDAESGAIDSMLSSLPEPFEFGSMLPFSSQSSSDDLFLSREVSIESRLSSMTSLSSKGFRIPPKAKAMLDSWVGANIEDPYLKQGDAEALAHLTSLTPAQVKTYISNARLRKPSTSKIIWLPEVLLRADSTLLDTTLSQASSVLSLPSYSSLSSLAPRKGRKRYRASTATSISSSSALPRDANKIYQCTFCIQAFGRKSDWKRHEQALHVPQEEWICTPGFPTFISDTGAVVCAFCEQESPDEVHLQDYHRYQTCFNKPPTQKTFNRKDKLQQHFAQVHKQPTLTAYTSTNWMRPLNKSLQFRCGFCLEILQSWSTRSDHIAQHFESGSEMLSWQGELGGILD
jgi:hypothetical protein